MSVLSFQCRADLYKLGPMPSSVPASSTMSAEKARNLLWQTENWTGSDQPFQQTHDRIETALKQGATLDGLLNTAEATAVKEPYEPTAQYAWGYLAFKAVKSIKHPNGRDPKFVRLLQRLTSSTQGMTFGKQPHSYEYSRLLFLTKSYALGSADYAPIGHRLMERNADDDEVRSQLIRTDTDSFYPPRTQEALDYTRYLFRKFPNSAGFYKQIGDIYFGDFLVHKQPDMADKALENWHKSFQISPPSKPVLEDIQRNVKWIRKVEADQKRKRNGGRP